MFEDKTLGGPYVKTKGPIILAVPFASQCRLSQFAVLSRASNKAKWPPEYNIMDRQKAHVEPTDAPCKYQNAVVLFEARLLSFRHDQLCSVLSSPISRSAKEAVKIVNNCVRYAIPLLFACTVAIKSRLDFVH